MASEWRTVSISDLCTGIYDGPHATPKKTSDGPIFLGISNLTQGRIDLSSTEHLSEEDFATWTRRITPQAGDVVFSYETRLGEVGLIPKGLKCCLGRRMALMRPNPLKADSRFLLYAYLSPGFQDTIRARTIHGSTVDRIPLVEFPSFPIKVPPLDEQKEIAHVLGTLDDKIELNQQMNRTLEGIARALFKSWFIDFDPVRAKLDSRQPYGIDAETAALFPDSFDDSPLGKIPKGWRGVPLTEAVDVNPKRSLSQGKMAPYLDMKNMPTQGHRPDGWVYRQYGSGTKFIQGDTLLARITPCLENGKTAFVDFLPEGEVGWGSTEYIVLRPKPPLPVEFGYFLARSDELRAHAISNMTGSSGRQRVPVDCFASLLLTIPSDAVAQKFGQAVTPLMAQIRSNSEQNISIASIRDALLPKLLSDEIRVKESEQALEAAA